MTHISLGIVALVAVMSLATAGARAACGKVTIAEFNWASAAVIAHVQKRIMEAGYGCKVRLLPGSSIPTLTSMTEKQVPDVNPEIWINSMERIFRKALDEGRIVELGPVLKDGGVEAWYIPAYFAKAHPEIKTIQDIIKNAHLFRDPEEPDKGRFYTCPAGWTCQIVNENLFKAYDMDKAFTLFDPGSSEGLAGAIARAYERGKPIFTYYWEPTDILGKYKMVPIELAPFNAQGHKCNVNVDCAKPYPGRYPASRVVTGVTAKFKAAHPDLVAFLRKLSWSNKVVGKVLAWGKDNQAESSEMADHFLKTQQALWSAWLPPAVAAKVKASL